MAQILHGSARTTASVRRSIQHSQESIAGLARRCGINPKTVVKWKKRSFTHDAAMEPKVVQSNVLNAEEEALIVAFRQQTLLSLDDCLFTLRETIPHLTRSSLHRCLQRHGLSRLPDVEGDKPKRKKFEKYPIGYFHIDIAEVRTEEGKVYMFAAIDRTSKFTYVELYPSATRPNAASFLRNLIAAVPYRIHTVLTDNGIQFTNFQHHKYAFKHIFDRICEANGIEHRLTRINHPWTNGRVERMKRTLKEATVDRYYYATHDQLREHLNTYVMAHNYARRIKALNGLTPYEFLSNQWQKEPERFYSDPIHLTVGLNTC